MFLQSIPSLIVLIQQLKSFRVLQLNKWNKSLQFRNVTTKDGNNYISNNNFLINETEICEKRTLYKLF